MFINHLFLLPFKCYQSSGNLAHSNFKFTHYWQRLLPLGNLLLEWNPSPSLSKAFKEAKVHFYATMRLHHGIKVSKKEGATKEEGRRKSSCDC